MPMWPVDNLAILVRVSDNTTFILLHESWLLFVFLQMQLLIAVHILDRTQNIIIALDDVTCTTAQSRLINCTYDSNTGDCSHSDDAGVQCVPREFHIFYIGMECYLYS